jgi:putative ABC transport system permease protein
MIVGANAGVGAGASDKVRAGLAIERIEPLAVMHAALDDHVLVITRAAVVLAGILALVGLLGLAAALVVSVLERTREIGMMKAIGASSGRVARRSPTTSITCSAARASSPPGS